MLVLVVAAGVGALAHGTRPAPPAQPMGSL
jgi:hypothetical protein